MSSSSLTLTLIPEQRPGRFILTYGSVSYPIEFRPDTDVTLGDLLRRLHPVLAGGRDWSKKHNPIELLQAVGTRLWKALLPDTTPTDKREPLERELRTAMTPLLLALPPDLSLLPWELLCDPQQPDDSGFLARRRCLTRLSPGGTNLPPLTPPLRVLLLISSPPGLNERQRIDIEGERTAIESATREAREAGLLHLFVEDIVTPQQVEQALLGFKPHLLHYIGHGNYQEEIGGYLVWEDEQGEPLQMFDTRLADLLRSRGLRAVLLHSCQTASSDARTEFRSVARTLLNAGIPAVLAQQASLTYESSQRASDMFYTALISGLGLAEATFEARQALAQARRPDWAVPVLQATLGGLAPILDTDASLGSPDPALTRSGAAADLPAPTGVFVGRQHELRALRTMLESASVTGPAMALITGPGGIGKSTIVAQAVTRYGERYKAALTLSCGGYLGMEPFLHRMGEFLQRQEESSFLEETLPNPKLSMAEKTEAAIEALNQAGTFLLVVDNLESVQREDRTVTDPDLLLLLHKLLTNLRGGRVLVTGRFAVEGLLPDGKFMANLLRLDLDDLSHYETQQLLERHPPLAHLGETIRAELVQAFGGLPYIYDLLSTKASTQNLRELIHDAQGRITDEHQRRATTEWQQVRRQVSEFAALEAIVARLPEQARELLARLSVFRSPFPQEALEQGLGVAPSDWQLLVDNVLLRYNSADGTYRLHSLTAHYAEGLLNASDHRSTQVQIAEWYQHYANDKSNQLTDYLEAHRLFRAAGEIQRAGELAVNLGTGLSQIGLYQLWHDLCSVTIYDMQHNAQGIITVEAQYQLGMIAQERGRYDDAQQLYEEALVAFKQLSYWRGYTNTLRQLGTLGYLQGKYDEARRLYDEALKLSEQLGDSKGYAVTLYQLGVIAFTKGQYKEAQRLHNEVLKLSEQLGDLHLRTATLRQLAFIAQQQGQYDEALRFLNESLSIKERPLDRVGHAIQQQLLGKIAREQGRYAEARRLYSKALTLLEQLDHPYRYSTLLEMGIIAQEQGNYEEARQLYNETLAAFERLGDLHGNGATLHQLGMIAQEQGQYDEARQFYNKSLTIKKQLGDLRGHAATQLGLGNVSFLQGHYREAQQLYDEARQQFEHLDDLRGRTYTLSQLGLIALYQEDYDEVRRLYGEVLRLCELSSDPRGRGNALLNLGVAAYVQGQLDEAHRLHNEALKLFEELGDQRGRANALLNLGNVAREQGQYDEARRWYTEALPILIQLDDLHERAKALEKLGDIAQKQEQCDEAWQLYNEAVKLFEQLDDLHACISILHQLGVIAQKQEQYGKARHLYNKALGLYKELGDQNGYAVTLHELGNIAFMQRQYDEAQQLYTQALAISEQVADEEECASILGQLGLLARRQNNDTAALGYTAKALGIFERLQSSQRDRTLRVVTSLRSEMDIDTFATIWQEVSEGLPLPGIFDRARNEELLQHLEAFVQASVLIDLQHLVEKYPDLLNIEADTLLKDLAIVQPNEEARNLVEQRRALLIFCREIGIAPAFAELQAVQEQHAQEDYFAAQLNTLCYQVVEVLRAGGKERQETLARQLDHMIDSETPLEGVHDFLALLAAWLRGDDVTERVETLRPDFQDAYHQMVDVVTDGEPADNDDEQQASLASQMVSMLAQFARADWAARYQLLTAHADVLLAESIEAVFDALLAVNKESEERQFLEELHTLLHRCRTWGVDPVWYLALQMHLGDDIAIPPEHEAAVIQIATLLSQQQEDDGALVVAIEAMQELLNGQIDEAVALFKAAFLWDLADVLAQLPAGHPLRNLKQMETCYREALPYYQADDRRRSVALLHRSLVNVLTEQGHYAEALEPLQAAIRGLRTREQDSEETAWVLSNYANVLDNLGRTEEALAAYREAITLLPESAPFYRNRAEALIHLRRLAEAEASLAQAVTLDGHEQSPYLWYRRAQVAIARGDGLLADQMLDEVVKREASFDVALQRAQAAWLQGRLEAAQETCQQEWKKANLGERAAIRREMERLFEEHSELDRGDALQNIMRRVDE
jgi:tetratricopeptide (TPR) repeat protein